MLLNRIINSLCIHRVHFFNIVRICQMYNQISILFKISIWTQIYEYQILQSTFILHVHILYVFLRLSQEHCCNPWAMKEQPLSNKISEYMAFARLCFRFVSSVLLKSVMISSCGSWPLRAVNVIGIINGRGFWIWIHNRDFYISCDSHAQVLAVWY